MKTNETDRQAKTCRTSISLSAVVRERADDLIKDEGFTSFSDLVEYLLRKEWEREQEQKAALAA